MRVFVSVCVFFSSSAVMQHAEEQRLSQAITPSDGSVLLHNEMKLKCLIDFSFTFLTSGGNIVGACGCTGAPGLRGPVVSL